MAYDREKYNSPIAIFLRDNITGNITQAKVANAIGVSRQVISTYVNGEKKPSENTLRKLSEFFNVPVEQITGGVSSCGSSTENKVALLNEIGLNEQTYSVLKKFKSENDIETKDRTSKARILNDLIYDGTIFNIVEMISSNIDYYHMCICLSETDKTFEAIIKSQSEFVMWKFEKAISKLITEKTEKYAKNKINLNTCSPIADVKNLFEALLEENAKMIQNIENNSANKDL